MTLDDLAPLLATLGLPVVAVAVIGYVLLAPEKAEKVAGWVWGLIAKVVRRASKAAVARQVQGHVNTARAGLLKDAPEGLVEGRLQVHWNDAESAEAVVRDGEVVVFMRRGAQLESNVANALMAYLPKAVIPRARRYVEPATMLGIDLTMAKAVLGEADAVPGAIHSFFDEHLDPALEDDAVRRCVEQMDEIDLHGWLVRIVLPELKRLGEELHPGQPTAECLQDAEGFASWLHRLAARAQGDDTLPLAYQGRYLRVAVVFVAVRAKLMEQGVGPYRKKAKSLVYSGKYDAVYLMARDDNIDAVDEILEILSTDGRVAEAYSHTFNLRSDFAKRKIRRERGIIACLRPKVRGRAAGVAEDLEDAEVEVFDPDGEIRASGPVREDTA